MTTKVALIATAAIAVGAIVLGLGLLFLFVDPNSRNAEQRAAMLGQGMAMACLVPLAVIWIMWAVRIRKDRERKQSPPSARR